MTTNDDIFDEILQGDICQYCKQVFMMKGSGVPRTCSICEDKQFRPKRPKLDKRPS
ncbi:MAG: hypothetical protein ACC707_14910 [Thiohalomonadales bacterium]